MLLLSALVAAGLVARGPPPPPEPPYNRTMKAYLGSTPTVDGIISPGEWDDAFEIVTPFSGSPPVMQWASEFSQVTDPADLSLQGWMKHDDKALYLGFNITDDLLHGVETAHWAPPANPQVDALNQSGWPWFGDEMEILLNAAGPPDDCAAPDPSKPHAGGLEVVGNETEWQMVLNLAKSRLGGVGVGGLLEGEPRDSLSAWNNYGSWIKSGKMKGAAKVAKQSKGANVWVAEWEISFDLMQIEPGKPYSADMPDTTMGINIALGDVDTPQEGAGYGTKNGYGIRHEQWPCGNKAGRTHLCQFCTFHMMKAKKPETESDVP